MKSFQLKPKERHRLRSAIEAVLGVPVIDGIEDYVWEAIFAHTKGLTPSSIRNKRLYDVVDKKRQIGWSAKTIQCSFAPGHHFEYVIQRANIIGKGVALGYGVLTINSDPRKLGEALLHLWYQKVDEDAKHQGINDARIAILLKSPPSKSGMLRFGYLEAILPRYETTNLRWEWSTEGGRGLKAYRKEDNECVFKWYHSGTQLFERLIFPEDAFSFEVTPQPMNVSEFVELLLSRLHSIS
jgi:hypothetical protein